MKKVLAITVILVLFLTMVIAIPANAASYTFDTSSTPSSATSPIMYNPANGYFYLWFGGNYGWFRWGNSLDVQIRLCGDWTFPASVTSAVGYTFPTVGYEILPSEFVSFNPPVISAENNVWCHSYVSLSIPNLPQYAGKHYKVTLNYTATCTTGGQVIIKQSQSISFYIVTP